MSVCYKLNSEQLDIFHFLTFSNFTPTQIFFSKTCDVTLLSLSDFGLKLKAKNENLYHHQRFYWTDKCFIFHNAKEFSQLAPKMTQLEPFLCREGNFSEISNLSKLQFSPVLVVILKIVLEAQLWGQSPKSFLCVTEISEIQYAIWFRMSMLFFGPI